MTQNSPLSAPLSSKAASRLQSAVGPRGPGWEDGGPSPGAPGCSPLPPELTAPHPLQSPPSQPKPRTRAKSPTSCRPVGAHAGLTPPHPLGFLLF